MPLGTKTWFNQQQVALGQKASAIDLKNFQLSKANFRYQKQIQRNIFNREDSSIRRRVNDLKAAGLSPVLAAGQGARAGAVVSTQPPQQSTSGLKMQQDAYQNMFANALGAINQANQVARTLADTTKSAFEIGNLRSRTNLNNVQSGRLQDLLPGEITLQSTIIDYNKAKTESEKEQALKTFYEKELLRKGQADQLKYLEYKKSDAWYRWQITSYEARLSAIEISYADALYAKLQTEQQTKPGDVPSKNPLEAKYASLVMANTLTKMNVDLFETMGDVTGVEGSTALKFFVDLLRLLMMR